MVNSRAAENILRQNATTDSLKKIDEMEEELNETKRKAKKEVDEVKRKAKEEIEEAEKRAKAAEEETERLRRTLEEQKGKRDIS